MWALILLSLASSATEAEALLERARELYVGLEYEAVLPVVEQVLASDASVEQQVDAHVLKGSCLAIIGRTVDAEAAFRLSLRARPGLDLPAGTPPKILTVFKKVKLEEERLGEELEELERQRIIKTLQLDGGVRDGADGGAPLRFAYALTDPKGAVAGVRVSYRKRDEAAFSAIALSRGARGQWSGEIPGAWTANPDGIVVEFFTTTVRGDGVPLLTRGSEAAPLSIELGPGEAQVERPLLATPWFWGVTAVAVAVAATAVGGGIYLVTAPPSTGLGVVDANP